MDFIEVPFKYTRGAKPYINLFTIFRYMRTLHFIVTTIFLTLICSPVCYAQSDSKTTDDKLFKKWSKIDDAQYANISSFMISMGRMLAKGEEKAFLEKLDSMRVLDLSACSDSIKEAFVESISNTQLADFLPAEEEINDEQRTRVYLQMNDEYIGRIVIAQLGKHEYMLMQINGKLTLKEIEDLSKKQPPIK